MVSLSPHITHEVFVSQPSSFFAIILQLPIPETRLNSNSLLPSWQASFLKLDSSLPTTTTTNLVKVILRLTVTQSASLGVEPHLGLMTRYLLLFDSYGLVFVGRPLWREAESDLRICWWPCQRSLSRVWVPWHSRPYFTVSDLRLPFPSPPATRRVTVEVFDPASTRVWYYSMLPNTFYNHFARITQETQPLLLTRSVYRTVV
jgi:hypothetical protein